jgi:soluble lytic murein transglycosylase
MYLRPWKTFALLLGLVVPAALGRPAPGAAPLNLQLLPTGDDDLSAYLDQADISAIAKRRFLNAARSSRSGRELAAEREFLEVARTAPALADWAFVLAADAAARRGDTLRAREHIDQTSGWLAREWGWRVRVRGVQARSGARAAADLALREAERLQLTSASVQAQRNAAELLIAAHATEPALELLRGLLNRELDAALLRSSAVLLSRTSNQPADRLQSARLLLRAGDYSSAANLLPVILRSAETAGRERAQLRIDLARHYLDIRQYTRAERMSADLAADPTEPSDLRSEGRVVLGRTYLRSGKRAPAIVQLERVLTEDAPSAVAEAAFVLGDLDADLQSSRAEELFRRSAASAPRTSSGTESLMRLGLAAFARGHRDSALHWFDQAREGAPRFQQRATYWSGRVRLDVDEEQASELLRDAITRDPISYYAFRAADQLKAAALPLAGVPESNDATDQRMQRAFDRYELLRKAELFDLASFELERLRRTFAGDAAALYSIAERMHAAGQTQSAIALGRALQRERGVWDDRLLRIVYPLPFREIIVSEARKQGVDPFLAAALIRQESAFNPRAISVAGARGLMQVMPQTGRTVARKSSVSKYRVARLYEPALNVRLGMQHLKTLLEAHAGRLAYVLSAYNAGPNRLDQWMRFPEAMDDELFAERIPFAETRDYVRIVQQNAHIYRRIYGNGQTTEVGTVH